LLILTEVYLKINLGATRLRRESTLNPIWRHARQLLPFGIVLSGVAFYDKTCGLYD